MKHIIFYANAQFEVHYSRIKPSNSGHSWHAIVFVDSNQWQDFGPRISAHGQHQYYKVARLSFMFCPLRYKTWILELDTSYKDKSVLQTNKNILMSTTGEIKPAIKNFPTWKTDPVMSRDVDAIAIAKSSSSTRYL